MRRAIVVLVALGWLLLGLAPAAQAKGPTAAVIEGPGITTPVRVESYEAVGRLPDIGTLMQRTGGDVMFGDVVRLDPDAPATELGARFTVQYLMNKDVVLTQELYPFAEGGPYTFTPPGQRSLFVEAEMATGWFRGTAELTTTLERMGATKTEAGTGPDASDVVAEQAVPAGWWLGGGAAVVAVVLALAGVVVSRHRRGVGPRR